MGKRICLLTFIPVLCAIFIVLGLTMLKPSHETDLTRGISTGVLIGLSILSIAALKGMNPQPGERN